MDTPKEKKKFSGNITLTRAIKIFEALGFKTAGKWDAKRLEQKITNLPTLVEGAELTPKIQKRVNTVLRALKRGQKITVIDVEDIEPGKKRDKAVKDAEKREVERKSEEKVDTKKKAKASKKKAAKKEVAKKQAKEAVAATKKKGKERKAGGKAKDKKQAKKPGLMMSMYEFIQKEGPISARKILSLLKKRFPEHNLESMERCIPRYPKCLADSRGIKDIVIDDKGQYCIRK